jgi:hypothetical protein
LLIHITIVGLYKPKSQRNLDLRKIPLKPQLAVLGCIMYHIFLYHDISCASHLYIAGCPFPIPSSKVFINGTFSVAPSFARAGGAKREELGRRAKSSCGDQATVNCMLFLLFFGK